MAAKHLTAVTDPVHAVQGAARDPDGMKAGAEVGLWDTPTLDHVRRAALAARVRPSALLGVLLAVVSAELSHTVVLPDVGGLPGSLGLYVAVCAEPGKGKGQAIATARRLIPDARAVLTHPASGEGLLTAFRDYAMIDVPVIGSDAPAKTRRVSTEVWVTRNALAIFDEVGTLEALDRRDGSTLFGRLRTLWSGGPDGSGTSSRERRRHLPGGEYRLAVIVAAQPGKVGALIGQEAQRAGTAHRFLFVHPARRRGVDDLQPRPDWPGHLPMAWPVPRGLAAEDVPPDGPPLDDADLVVIDVAPPIAAEVDAALDAASYDDTPADHTTQLRLRLAALLAILHGGTEVTPEHWERARLLLMESETVQGDLLAHEATEGRRARQAQGQAQAEREEARDRHRLRGDAARMSRHVAQHTAQRAGQPCATKCVRESIRQDARPNWRSIAEHAQAQGWLTYGERPDVRGGDRPPVPTFEPGTSNPPAESLT
ncbi:DUF3987 domain-containing protein [Demequina subtropica]|uniref:DUF3987 domain-containing protein n=1 Tax=Demequina subtropica TaxID=1638989 RepID=UPI00078637D1|nr:DUF3987 domain-containing protein [Demequina subtropica]